MNSNKIIIIGGGLTGLTLQYLLSKKNIDSIILEARDRLGGRIFTSYLDGQAPLELGATWFGEKHIKVIELLNELAIQKFPQELSSKALYEPISTSPHQLVDLPQNQTPSYRIKGGTSAVINQIAKLIDKEKIRLNQAVKSIKLIDGIYKVQCATDNYESKIIVSTLPPFLFFKTIAFKPQLPAELLSIMDQTHTWMGESIKFGLNFKHAFWRKPNSSGTLFSNVGPIPEMYDHSDFDDNYYALKGFLNGTYFASNKEFRSNLIIAQLKKYYGSDIENFSAYQELVWKNEKYTSTAYDKHILPHQNNGHHVYQNSYFDDSLFIGGSETAVSFPGYMEGAISSAQHIYHKLLSS